VVWATPFLAEGTVLNVSAAIPDVHDWDVSWGTILTKSGTEKVVIGHDKLGNVIAMNAATGKPIWWITLGTIMNADKVPTEKPGPITWPGPGHGVEAYAAADNTAAYFSVSSGAFRFSTNMDAAVSPAFDAPGMENGLGNGTIVALNLTTGKIIWQHPTPAPTWVSPLVTNGIVFCGHVSGAGVGKPYKFNTFGTAVADAPIVAKGVILALDAATGHQLWSDTLPVPVGIGGPSISNGVLLVTTGNEDEVGTNTKGKIFAYGL